MIKPITLNRFGRRTKLIQTFKEQGFTVGAEIGTDHGQYAEQLLQGVPNLSLYCIDPWAAYTEGNTTHSQEEMDKMYEQVWEKLTRYNCKIMRKTSMEAVSYFPDNNFDFVFIDGNHEYPFVLEDIEEWTKKVRSGGIVCGHDYKEDPVNKYGVIEAVQEYCDKNNIQYYILHAGGKLVDCWLFYKP